MRATHFGSLAAALLVPAGALLVLGCGAAEGRMLAQPVVDSLPGGIPRTMSPAATAWVGETGWQVELVQEFSGEEQTPAELIEPQSLAVDEWRRVYVVDQKPSVVKVYGPEGAFIRTVGGQGEGPGEFRAGYIAVHGANVVLHDPRVGRTSVWDTAGTFQRSWPSACCSYGDIAVDREGRITIPTTRRAYQRWTLEGEAVDTLTVPLNTSSLRFWTVSTIENGRPLNRLVTMVPLTPRVVTGFNPDGGFLVGWSASYQIAVAPHGTDTTAVFGRAWTPDPVATERKHQLVERMVRDHAGGDITPDLLRGTFKFEDIPNQAAAFVALHVDPLGNRWVRLDPGLDSTRTVFDLFSAEGVYLGRVPIAPIPPEFGLLAFGRDEVVVARENEAGVPVVMRYRVRR